MSNKRFFKTHIGLVFSRLTILSLDHEVRNDLGIVRDRYYRCKCSCGKECVKSLRQMLKGNTSSCGCYRVECGKAKRTHGEKYGISKEYTAWKAMRSRCLRPQPKDVSAYAGITIDPRWDKFENFLADMGRKPSLEHSLDRIDVHKGYGPDNCRWATVLEQQTNKKNTFYVIDDGKKISFRIACELHGKKYRRMYHMIKKRGLTWKQALEKY